MSLRSLHNIPNWYDEHPPKPPVFYIRWKNSYEGYEFYRKHENWDEEMDCAWPHEFPKTMRHWSNVYPGVCFIMEDE